MQITNGAGQKVGRKPSIAEKGGGLHGVTYVAPLVGEPYEVAVFYGGVEIPDSPFPMTSNPSLDDVIDGGSLSSSGKKPSRLGGDGKGGDGEEELG